MKEYLAKFSALKPQERRFIIVVAVGIFVGLNWAFVWPYWGDLGRQQLKMHTAETTLSKYRAEFARTNQYIAAINKITASERDVPAEDQAIHFDSSYRDHAVANKVLIISSSRPSIHTNEFFIEHEVGVNVQAKESDLVDFLWSLGDGDSLIRVKAVGLHPDPSHQQLAAGLTIVASYKRTKPGPVSAAKPAAAAPPTTQPKVPPPPSKAALTNKPAGPKTASMTNKTATPNLLKRP